MAEAMIRDARAEDFPAIVALNADEVRHTSPMDAGRLRELAALSTRLRVAVVDGQVAAFLLAMRDGVPYDNQNYRWFSAKFEAFVYVDRIVVGRAFQGHRLGSRLYADLFAFAGDQRIPRVVCEFNVVPPNEPSRLFHARHGFEEVGSEWILDGEKRVSMQAADV